ncbi:MAG: LysM peptidoglycan-binding domain-containing protein [Oribacterium sp.]|nr:LysM peptidoglycan-binding domain-containing protein [Oribacterium sp.]MDD6789603.1 LysM peptidoglycan-binding domain-containing protein [Lachnospira sp.]
MDYTAERENYYRIRKRRQAAARRKKARRREVVLALSAAAIVLILIMIRTSTVSATPSADEPKEKYYTSITIQKNDTLWDIAGRYYNASVENRSDYIRNIKKVNNLSGSKIKTGNNLVVYYWVPEARDAEK